jgi:hypothetical protein
MYFDGDDDKEENGVKEGDYTLPDDIGERIGEGHDPVEDEIT